MSHKALWAGLEMCVVLVFSATITNQIITPVLFLPVKRAVVLAGFEVLSRQLFERGDASTPRVLAAPQNWSKQRAFERSRGDLFATKLLTPSGPAKAVQNRFAILSLYPFLCQQRKGLARRGETLHPRHAAGIR